MSLKDELEPALEEMEEDLDYPTFVWRGLKFRCIPNTLLRGTTVVLGGYQVEITLSLIVRKEELGTAAPSAGQVITYPDSVPVADPSARLYRIASVGDPSSHAHVSLNLTDSN
jgi:hypothetical protein